MKRASSSISAATGSIASVGAPVPPLPPLSVSAAASSVANELGISSDTPLTTAATILADRFRSVPGVENHLALRLRQLDSKGPRPLREVWRLAKSRLAPEIEGMTVGELIARYGTGVTRDN
jgi:hypothetical protein